MKREIKFRALKDDISNCSFMYGQLVYDAIGRPRITEVDSSGQGLLFHTCIKNTESQYTGLKDKNGKEIYEGDVVYQGEDKTCWFSPRVVEFINGAWMGEGFNKGGHIRIYVEQDRYEYKGIVSNNEWIIIGNIYENPELLTQ